MSPLRLIQEQVDAHIKRISAQSAKLAPPRPDPVPQAMVAPTKYRNRPTGGYASVKEARRAAELKLLEKAGQIRNLREQVRFELIPKQGKERACSYVADFVYDELPDDSGFRCLTIIEDVKGIRPREYIIKRKLMLFVHGITIRET